VVSRTRDRLHNLTQTLAQRRRPLLHLSVFLGAPSQAPAWPCVAADAQEEEDRFKGEALRFAQANVDLNQSLVCLVWGPVTD